jgi:hypothetical protein
MTVTMKMKMMTMKRMMRIMLAVLFPGCAVVDLDGCKSVDGSWLSVDDRNG